MKEYVMSVDYSPSTGIRNCDESDFSGEHFYHTKLNAWFSEAYANQEPIKIILDGGDDGYGPSFRDEAFGNLIYDFGLDVVSRLLILEAPGDDMWKEEIEGATYQNWEMRKKKGEAPRKTENHAPWNRLVKGELVSNVWINKS